MEVTSLGAGEEPPAPKRLRHDDPGFAFGGARLPTAGFVAPAAHEVVPVGAPVRRLLCGYGVVVDGPYSEADLDCPVCQSPAVEGSMLTGCGHTFHEECISAVMHHKQACPVCQLPAPRNSLRPLAEIPAARYLRNALLMLPVRCPQGCAVNAMPWEVLQAHIRDECPATQVRCACGASMARSLCETSHRQLCAAACVECELCGQRMLRGEWGRHVNDCPKISVSCNYCHARLVRSDFADHLRNHCSARVPVSLFLRVCDRARSGHSVLFAPIISEYAHALAGSTSGASTAKLEAELLHGAERLGRPTKGDQWKQALRDELADYAVCVSCFKPVQIFVKGNRTVTLTVHLDDTVEHMLAMLNSKTGERIRGRDLTVGGRGLYREDATLRDYGVQQESTLYTRTLTSF